MLSAVSQQISATAAAVGMLSERLGILQAYIVAVKRKEVPVDYNLLRKIAAIAQQVPALPDPTLLTDLRKVRTVAC